MLHRGTWFTVILHLAALVSYQGIIDKLIILGAPYCE
jgi:hypothetical protein